ncbi:acyl-[acyl-carrier-protein] thioesterase [Aerococcus tenax]|uniref:acyl-[acyl-carrier-protein] thioesterase n=1 Tax=Aerococcus tenax TaxID=3078812 RepID=UPI0018A6FFA3|nr:acyl-ACP thioesterase domain-containing protein [Aerococcus tenax]
MAASYQKDIIISQDQCDQEGRIQIKGLIALFLALSADHDQALKQAGFWSLDSRYIWVIVENHLSINRLAECYESVTVTTELTGANAFFVKRSFSLVDQDRALLAKCTMVYTLIDFVSRQIERVDTNSLDAKLGIDISKRIRLNKIKFSPTEDADLLSEFLVDHQAIDQNKHVNNLVYLDWIFRQVGQEFIESWQVKDLIISYKHELYEGDRGWLKSEINQAGDKQLLTKHKIVSFDDNIHASVEISWNRKD